MIDSVIFDMDGLLIDSEHLWKRAEKIVFSSLGVVVTEEEQEYTATLLPPDLIKHWYNQSPWQNKSLDAVEEEVIDLVDHLIFTEADPMPGVHEILELFHSKNFKIALATNSPLRLVPTVLNKLGIKEYFSVISSAEFEVKGKPDPAVYLSTAQKLKVSPTRCIVFEDSVIGVEAARNANMRVVAVPEVDNFHRPDFDLADLKLHSLHEFKEAQLELIQSL